MKTLHQTLDASWRTGLYLMFITVCLLAPISAGQRKI